jgi:hypothetical protein
MCNLLGIGSESGCVSASKSNFGFGPGSAFEQYQSDFHKLRGLLPAWISILRVRNAHYLDAWTRQVILSALICMFPFFSSQETGPFLVKISFLNRKALVWRCSGRTRNSEPSGISDLLEKLLPQTTRAANSFGCLCRIRHVRFVRQRCIANTISMCGRYPALAWI